MFRYVPEENTYTTVINIENFTEESGSNSFQAELGLEILESLGIKIAYNYLDVFRIEEEKKKRLPFTSKHHILNTFSYQPINKDWHFDFYIALV